jgi:hypothetical protein
MTKPVSSPHPSHAWAVLGTDGTPLFHVPGTCDPPVWEKDDALEALWRKGQRTQCSNQSRHSTATVVNYSTR